jgi:hypothetical protein
MLIAAVNARPDRRHSINRSPTAPTEVLRDARPQR